MSDEASKPPRSPKSPKSPRKPPPTPPCPGDGLPEQIAEVAAELGRDYAQLRADVVTELKPQLDRMEQRLQTIEALLRQIHGPAEATSAPAAEALLRQIQGPAEAPSVQAAEAPILIARPL